MKIKGIEETVCDRMEKDVIDYFNLLAKEKPDNVGEKMREFINRRVRDEGMELNPEELNEAENYFAHIVTMHILNKLKSALGG